MWLAQLTLPLTLPGAHTDLWLTIMSIMIVSSNEADKLLQDGQIKACWSMKTFLPHNAT